jgi:hypothetical protein
MATIAENIATIQVKAAEMDALIIQFRAAKAEIDAAEAEIRQLRPVSEPSRAYQERLALVALDAMGKPAISGEATISELAASAWVGIA